VNEAIPTTQKANPTRSRLRRGIRFALIGLVFGFLGLGTATYRMSVEAEPPPPPKTKEISDVLADTLKKAADKLRHKQPPPPPQPADVAWPFTKKLGLAASILGFIGAAFGCVSWLVGEHRRWTWAALGVGVAALAWTHVVVAAGLAVGIALLLLILGHLG
jgi:hypothetical protein